MNKYRLVALVVSMTTFGGMSSAVAAEPGAQPQPRRQYHYVDLDAVALPAGFTYFDAVAINDSRSVYGTAYQCDAAACGTPTVLVYRKGKVSTVHAGIAYSANNLGTVGGSVSTDSENGIEQAALFYDDGTMDLIPRLPGESTSHVRKVTNTGIALVESVNGTTGRSSFYLYLPSKQVLPLDLGTEQVLTVTVNDRGIVAGTITPAGPANDRAFRYNPLSGVMTLLDPLPTEPDSWGVAINSRGDVLGYSFIYGGRERIGSWRPRKFVTSFVEGTPKHPTVSNRLLWNDHNLIVITNTSREDMRSYIVTSPGHRKNLANISDKQLDAWTQINDVNERGDMIGIEGPSYYTGGGTFILERTYGRP